MWMSSITSGVKIRLCPRMLVLRLTFGPTPGSGLGAASLFAICVSPVSSSGPRLSQVHSVFNSASSLRPCPRNVATLSCTSPPCLHSLRSCEVCLQSRLRPRDCVPSSVQFPFAALSMLFSSRPRTTRSSHLSGSRSPLLDYGSTTRTRSGVGSARHPHRRFSTVRPPLRESASSPSAPGCRSSRAACRPRSW